MTTVSINRILDGVRVQTPGCLDGTLRMELFNVTKEFCQRSDIWRESVHIHIQPNIHEYTIHSQDRALINRLLAVEGSHRTTGSDKHLFGVPRVPQEGYLDIAGENAILRIPRPPSEKEEWQAHISLAPIDPTDSEGLPRLPNYIVEKYQDSIQSGLLSRLMMYPGKPYSSPQMAQFHGRRFYTGVNLAKKEARQGFQLAGQRWVFPQQFAGPTSQRVW